MAIEGGQPSEDSKQRALTGRLGTFSIAFMVVAAAAPLGAIAANNPLGFSLGNGAGFPVAYVIMGAVLLLFSVGLGAMSKYVAKPGAFFSYIGSGLGRLPGAAAAWIAFVFYSALQIGLFAFLGYETKLLFDSIHIGGIPWWVFCFACIGVVGLLAYRNIVMSMHVLTVMLAFEVLVFGVLAIAILIKGGDHGLGVTSFAPKHVFSGNFGLGLLFACVSFIGFESTAIYRAEARDPDRTVPKATYIAVIGVSIFYLISAWILVDAWGPSQIAAIAGKTGSDFLQTTATRYIGSWYATVVNIFIVTSTIACALSIQNVVNRYYHALALSSLLPHQFATVHDKHGAPSLASLFNTGVIVLVTLLTLALNWNPYTQTYTWFSAVGVLGFLTLLAATCLAVVVFFWRRWSAAGLWQTLILPAAGFFGLLATLVIVIDNFPLVAGEVDAKGNPIWGATSLILIAIVVLAGLIGVSIAIALRTRAPHRYGELVSAEDKARLEGAVSVPA